MGRDEDEHARLLTLFCARHAHSQAKTDFWGLLGGPNDYALSVITTGVFVLFSRLPSVPFPKWRLCDPDQRLRQLKIDCTQRLRPELFYTHT